MTNQQKLIAILQEDAGAPQAGLPPKAAPASEASGGTNGNGHYQNQVEEEDNPVPKRGPTCIKCGLHPKRSKNSDYCKACWDQRKGKDAVGIPISNARRMEEAKAKAIAKLDAGGPDLSDSTSVSLKPGEKSYVRYEDSDGLKHIVGITMDKVQSKAMKFIWPGRIPKGKGVIAQGMPGKGKSMAVLSWAVRVTNGLDWPDGAKNEMGPQHVLWAGTEDDLEDTVKPRLQALGCDMTRFHVVKRVATSEGGAAHSRRLLIKNDIKALYKMLQEKPEIQMVIFDPITGFYGGADGNSSKDIRPIMEHLAEVARNTGVTIVAIMHENRRKDVTALERVLGSGAVGQVFRVGFRFSEDPKENGGYIMACSKTNYKTKGGLKYKIVDAEVKLDDGTVSKDLGKVAWGEQHNLSADDVIALTGEEEGQGAEPSVVDKAVEIFQRELANGIRLCAEVHRVLDEAGVDKNAKQRARWKLGIKTTGKAPGPYWWELPGSVKRGPDPTIPDQDAL